MVTGASSGIGAEIVKLLALQGAVPVMMARNKQKMEELAAQIAGDKAVYVVDVTSEEQVNQAVNDTIAKYGKIDVLINNAGYGIFNLCVDDNMKQVEEMMNVNYFGMVRCTKAVLPHMLANKSGQIVNIASMAGKIGSPKSSAYSATKHAVLGFTNCLRQELAGTGVYVSAVNPGPVDTPFFDQADPTGNYKQNIQWFILKPEQVARAVMRILRTKRAEKDIPFLAGFGTKLYQLFPRLLDPLFSRVVNKK